MQPNSPTPIQGAMQQQNQGQGQPTPTPSIIDMAQQRLQQGAQQLNSEDQQTRQTNEQNTPQQQAAISRALAALNPGANSGNKTFDTASKVGQAIQSPAYAGYCQQFVDDQTGAKTRYPTAAATWNAKVQSGEAHQGTDGMKPGDVVEFRPDNTNANLGHAAVVQKNGDLKMATYNGVQTFSLKDWTTHTGQVPLGYYSSK